MALRLRFPAALIVVSLSLTHCGDEAANDEAEGAVTAAEPSASATGTTPAQATGTMLAPSPSVPPPGSSPSTAASPTLTPLDPPAGTQSVPTAPISTPPVAPSSAMTGTGGSAPLIPTVGTGGSGESPEPGVGGANGGAAAVAGGGSGAAGASSVAGNAGAGGTPNAGDFVLSSADFADGEMIPDEFTCDGKAFGDGVSPQLAWSGAPPDTLSFAITFIDTTLTSKMPPDTNGYHWAMWDIQTSVMELPGGLGSGATLTDPAGAKQYSPFNPPAYLGPCPSFFEPANDEYAFTLYALDVETLPNPPSNVQELEQLFLMHAIATATLTGTSDAMPQ